MDDSTKEPSSVLVDRDHTTLANPDAPEFQVPLSPRLNPVGLSSTDYPGISSLWVEQLLFVTRYVALVKV